MVKSSKEFFSPKTLIPPGPAGYSHIAKVSQGAVVYVSGQVSSDASGKLIGAGDFGAQVEQVFANLEIAMEAAGGLRFQTRNHRDKWQIIHTWLLGARRLSNCSDAE